MDGNNMRLRNLNSISSNQIQEDKSVEYPRKVYIRTIFTKIGEIDTAKECFTAELVIQAKWREQGLDGISKSDRKNVNHDQFWSPKLYVSNLLSDVKDSTSHTVIFPHGDGDERAYVLMQRKLKGVFLENLELQEFPFDIQDITVTVTSELTKKEITLEEDEESPSAVNIYSFVDEQEWKLMSEVRVERGENEDIVVGGRSVGRKHPFINFKCSAERRYQFFLWNIVIVLVFICLMSFATFSVEYKLPQNRLQLTFILLLTTIAFKTQINNFLPKISYLTYMDIYILGSWSIQCLMCAWHAIVGNLLLNVTNILWVDKAFLIIFAVIYIAFQLIYGIVVYRKLRSKKRRPNNQSYNLQAVAMGEGRKLASSHMPMYKSVTDNLNNNSAVNN